MIKRLLALATIVVFFSGCAVNKMEAQLYPGKSLEGRDTYYVVRLDADENSVNQLIADRLNATGKTASTGPADATPEGVDVVVTYVDKWMWDITMYMLELTVVMREPGSDFPIAKGYSMHTSLTRKSPEEMVEEVLTNIFNEQAPSQ